MCALEVKCALKRALFRAPFIKRAHIVGHIEKSALVIIFLIKRALFDWKQGLFTILESTMKLFLPQKKLFSHKNYTFFLNSSLLFSISHKQFEVRTFN